MNEWWRRMYNETATENQNTGDSITILCDSKICFLFIPIKQAQIQGFLSGVGVQPTEKKIDKQKKKRQ